MMNIESRNQYLKELRKECLKTKSKKERGNLLDEAKKRTSLNRRYLSQKVIWTKTKLKEKKEKSITDFHEII